MVIFKRVMLVCEKVHNPVTLSVSVADLLSHYFLQLMLPQRQLVVCPASKYGKALRMYAVSATQTNLYVARKCSM